MAAADGESVVVGCCQLCETDIRPAETLVALDLQYMHIIDFHHGKDVVPSATRW